MTLALEDRILMAAIRRVLRVEMRRRSVMAHRTPTGRAAWQADAKNQEMSLKLSGTYCW